MSSKLGRLLASYSGTMDRLDLQLVLVDAAGRIAYANTRAELLLGASPGGLANRRFDLLFSPRNPEWLLREIHASARASGYAGDAVLTGLDGADRWAHLQICRFPEPILATDAYLVLLEDMSDRIEITDALMRRSEELFQRNRELEIVNKVSKLMLAGSDLESRLAVLVSETARTLGVDAGGVFIKDRSSPELVCRGVYGDGLADLVGNASVRLDEHFLVAQSVRARRTHVAEDMAGEPAANRDAVAQYHLKSVLSVPLIANDEAYGALVLCERRRHRSFSEEEITLVEIVAGQAASAIYSALLAEDVKLSRAHEQRLRNEIDRASRLASVGELLAGAAHSFGNVLMAIQGALGTARRGPMPASMADTLDQALADVTAGRDVVRRLLSLSRGSDAGPERVSPAQPAAAALALCKTHPSAKQRTIDNLVSADLPPVEAQAGPLEEVLFNLVLNALQATDQGGRVVVDARLHEAEGCLDLLVTDNGCGMEPDIVNRAFEPFFSTKDGTGLGLSASAAMVHRMGGVITVESVVGQGTTFTVRLNLADRGVAAQAA